MKPIDLFANSTWELCRYWKKKKYIYRNLYTQYINVHSGDDIILRVLWAIKIIAIITKECLIKKRKIALKLGVFKNTYWGIITFLEIWRKWKWISEWEVS